MARKSLKKKLNIYLLTKYIKSVLWGVAVCLSYIQAAWCLKVNTVWTSSFFLILSVIYFLVRGSCILH